MRHDAFSFLDVLAIHMVLTLHIKLLWLSEGLSIRVSILQMELQE